MNSKVNSEEIGVIGKIIIPKKIENYIDYLHKTVGAIEWSGILFYKFVGGDMSKLKDLMFRTEFLYPMNIGSHSYTEFEYSGEVMDAYETNPDLIECSTGMIHTHHNMTAFFSGTDTSELLSNAKNFNYYVSLIVNFTKEYKCKIAFPSKSIIKKEYIFRNDKGEFVKGEQTIEEEKIVVGELIVEFENLINVPTWLAERVSILKKKKTDAVKVQTSQVHKPVMYRDLWENYNFGASKTITGKQFLTALISGDTTGKDVSIGKVIVDLCADVVTEDIQYEFFEVYFENNLEIIHDDLYNSNVNINKHCKEALSELRKVKDIFTDEKIYKIIEETLELYAN